MLCFEVSKYIYVENKCQSNVLLQTAHSYVNISRVNIILEYSTIRITKQREIYVYSDARMLHINK